MCLRDLYDEVAAYWKHLATPTHQEPVPIEPRPQPSTEWKQSAAHPTREEWNAPAPIEEHGVVYPAFINGQVGFVERRADGKVIAQRGATREEKNNRHAHGTARFQTA